jgi:hypothetical protein
LLKDRRKRTLRSDEMMQRVEVSKEMVERLSKGITCDG